MPIYLKDKEYNLNVRVNEQLYSNLILAYSINPIGSFSQFIRSLLEKQVIKIIYEDKMSN